MNTSKRPLTQPASFGRRSLIVSGLGLGLVAGCGGGDDEGEANSRQLSFAPLGNGQMSSPHAAVEPYSYGLPPFEKPMFYALRSAFLFELFWTQAIQSRGSGGLPEIPEVDFSRQMVAGVFLGERRNGCFGLRIMDVRKQRDQVIVRYQEVVPGPFSGGGCTQGTVYPSRLIVIDHEPAILAFEQGPVIVG